MGLARFSRPKGKTLGWGKPSANDIYITDAFQGHFGRERLRARAGGVQRAPTSEGLLARSRGGPSAVGCWTTGPARGISKTRRRKNRRRVCVRDSIRRIDLVHVTHARTCAARR